MGSPNELDMIVVKLLDYCEFDYNNPNILFIIDYFTIYHELLATRT